MGEQRHFKLKDQRGSNMDRIRRLILAASTLGQPSWLAVSHEVFDRVEADGKFVRECGGHFEVQIVDEMVRISAVLCGYFVRIDPVPMATCIRLQTENGFTVWCAAVPTDRPGEGEFALEADNA